MTSIWWVRHGPTNRHDLLGWTDAPADLSDTARIDRLSDYLPADATVISSDLCRAVASADALQRQRPRLPHDPALREIHFGDWEGRSFAEVERAEPALSFRYFDQPGDTCAPGGESWNGLCSRVNTATDHLAGAHRALIVVAHFGAILTQVQRAKGCSAREALAQEIAPLSVTRLSLGPDGWQLHEVNRQP